MSSWYIFDSGQIDTAERKAFANALRWICDRRGADTALNLQTLEDVPLSELLDEDITPEAGFVILYGKGGNEDVLNRNSGFTTKVLGLREMANGDFAHQLRDPYELITHLEEGDPVSEIITFEHLVEGTGYKEVVTAEPEWLSE